jgi:hypothetical protein
MVLQEVYRTVHSPDGIADGIRVGVPVIFHKFQRLRRGLVILARYVERLLTASREVPISR